MLKSIKKYTHLIGILSVIILLTACGDGEVNPNPCLAETPVTAEFSIKRLLYDVKGMFDITEDLFEVDTVLLPFDGYSHLGQDVIFTTDIKYDSVKWIIGNDNNVFNKPSTVLYFNEPYGKIDATCIVYRKPNLDCFPNDNGIDTLTKSVHVLSDRDFDYPFEGKFEGYNEDEPDKLFTITIKDMGAQPPSSAGEWYGIRIQNLPEGCGGSEIKLDHFSPKIGSRLYRQFVITGSGRSNDCPPLEAFGQIIGDELTIKYSYSLIFPDYITKTFKGKKIK